MSTTREHYSIFVVHWFITGHMLWHNLTIIQSRLWKWGFAKIFCILYSISHSISYFDLQMAKKWNKITIDTFHKSLFPHFVKLYTTVYLKNHKFGMLRKSTQVTSKVCCTINISISQSAIITGWIQKSASVSNPYCQNVNSWFAVAEVLQQKIIMAS